MTDSSRTSTGPRPYFESTVEPQYPKSGGGSAELSRDGHRVRDGTPPKGPPEETPPGAREVRWSYRRGGLPSDPLESDCPSRQRRSTSVGRLRLQLTFDPHDPQRIDTAHKGTAHYAGTGVTGLGRGLYRSGPRTRTLDPLGPDTRHSLGSVLSGDHRPFGPTFPR